VPARGASTAERRGLALALVALAIVAGIWMLRRGDPEPPAAGGAATTTTGSSTTTAAPTTTTAGSFDPAAVGPTDRFATAAGSSPVAGSGGLRRYVVEIEEGIPLDLAELAAAIDTTLADPRGWTAAGDVALQRVDESVASDLRIRLATPATVDAHCAPLQTLGQYSCRQGDEVMINLTRWMEGAGPSGLSLSDYRHYVISHEVGHALGHGHVDCPAVGARAPVMVQQTISLEGCTPNPWPYP
jgi:Protein of unknown function (DUF3152)